MFGDGKLEDGRIARLQLDFLETDIHLVLILPGVEKQDMPEAVGRLHLESKAGPPAGATFSSDLTMLGGTVHLSGAFAC